MEVTVLAYTSVGVSACLLIVYIVLEIKNCCNKNKKKIRANLEVPLDTYSIQISKTKNSYGYGSSSESSTEWETDSEEELSASRIYVNPNRGSGRRVTAGNKKVTIPQQFSPVVDNNNFNSNNNYSASVSDDHVVNIQEEDNYLVPDNEGLNENTSEVQNNQKAVDEAFSFVQCMYEEDNEGYFYENYCCTDATACK
ncbi:hypothetical protein [Pteropox virus]|uniref:Uncharacterized protein n=1 Tax=Pteropox virus TaxID=1873698 RepID=A0A1B1MRP2_9POXV|nr:hypothetical protein [Pteropox virus]ANS71215.1 hypothetical protein [Pteropox virus]